MTLDEFNATLSADQPPDVSKPLLALWHDAKGDWSRAHAIVQEMNDATGAWIHAYLHRKDGDPGNAAYWYEQARQRVATGSPAAEWTCILTTLLAG